MKVGVVLFSVAAAIAWAALLFVSAHAVSTMGADAGGKVFIADFGHPWRAQFNTDLSIHLVLVAVWMIWRSRPWFVGIICALLAINLGALFTLPFLVIAAWRNNGNLGAVLLGRHYPGGA